MIGVLFAAAPCLIAATAAEEAGNAASTAGPEPARGTSSDANGGLEAPVLLTEIHIDSPVETAPRPNPIVVQARFLVDTTGAVAALEIVASGSPAFDEALLAALARLRFAPARWRGEPVAVWVTFSQEFSPPRDPDPIAVPSEQDTTPRAVAGAPRLDEGYETVITSRRARTGPSPTTLRGRELTHVPGTFGDPFRAVGALPGVAPTVSVLNYPVVRGTSPGATGFLLEGTPVPQLYHLLAGPAVVHPALIDRIDFYPGGFPSRYGGYTGGIVDARLRPRADERRLEVDVDLTKAGLLVQEPLGTTGDATVAGRYGYPGLLLGMLHTRAFFSYWDYQARLAIGRRPGLSVFAFGSFDEAGETRGDDRRPTARAQFHRLDLRFEGGSSQRRLRASLVLGADELLATAVHDANAASATRSTSTASSTSTTSMAASTLTTLTATPRLELWVRAPETLAVRIGFEGSARRARGPPDMEIFGTTLRTEARSQAAGAYLELSWEPVEAFVVNPSVRVDAYRTGTATRSAVDPRLSWRFAPGGTGGAIWLKGGVGQYHQPPRFYLPLPSLEEVALERGLLASLQASLGLEARLAAAVEVDVQVFYHSMDPILFDLALNPTDPNADPPIQSLGWEAERGGPTLEVDTDALDQLLARRRGRAYGLELLLRAPEAGRAFGWLSYTLSRSERAHDGRWVRFDFDRTHMLHLVAGLRLPRAWSVGLRLQLQSGRPVTTARGYNRGQTLPLFRADLRLDKRAAWKDWALDFYVDIANVALTPERLDDRPASALRYVLPTVGARALF